MDNSYFDSEDFQEILAEYEENLHSESLAYLDADDFADVADYYLSCDKPKLAKKAVERGLEVHPDDEVLLTVMVSVLIYEHRYSEARRCLKKNHLDSNDNYYQESQLCYALDGDLPRSQEMFRKWMSEEVSSIIETEKQEVKRDAYLHIISSYVELGVNPMDNDQVLDVIRKWIDEYIDTFQPLGTSETDLTLLDICRHSKLADKLVRILTQVLEEQPYLHDGWASLALGHFTLEQYEQAIEASDFALAINPHDSGAMLTRAYSHTALGQQEEACRFFEQYMSEPDHEELQGVPFADCLCKIGRKKDAAHMLGRGLTALYKEYRGYKFDDSDYSKRYIQTLCDAVCIYQALDLYPEAERCVRKLMEVEKDNAETTFMLGNVLLAQHEESEALTAFGQAINLANDNVKMAIDVALTLVVNNYDEFALEVIEAVEKMTRGLSVSKTSTQNLPAVKSLIFLKLNDADMFMRNFKKAIDCSPELVKTIFCDYFPESLDVSEYYDYAAQKLSE